MLRTVDVYAIFPVFMVFWLWRMVYTSMFTALVSVFLGGHSAPHGERHYGHLSTSTGSSDETVASSAKINASSGVSLRYQAVMTLRPGLVTHAVAPRAQTPPRNTTVRGTRSKVNISLWLSRTAANNSSTTQMAVRWCLNQYQPNTQKPRGRSPSSDQLNPVPEEHLSMAAAKEGECQHSRVCKLADRPHDP